MKIHKMLVCGYPTWLKRSLLKNAIKIWIFNKLFKNDFIVVNATIEGKLTFYRDYYDLTIVHGCTTLPCKETGEYGFYLKAKCDNQNYGGQVSEA